MYDDILQIGNKIDVVSTALLAKEKKGEGKAPVLVSQVDDVRDDGTIVIMMPIYKGKTVLLNVGVRYNLMFYSKKGLYNAVGQVTDRFREGNFAFAKVILTTNLSKFQRREYFRLSCAMPMKAYVINSKEAFLDHSFDVKQYVEIPEIASGEVAGTIVDISGGGMRFTSPTPFNNGSVIAIRAVLDNGIDKLDLVLGMYVINTRPTTNNPDLFETRGEFTKLDARLRERIIKFIFDEDRRVRKKG